jgi:hypothetical protein
MMVREKIPGHNSSEEDYANRGMCVMKSDADRLGPDQGFARNPRRSP